MGTLWLGGARWVWGLHTLQGLRASARGKVPGVGRDFFFLLEYVMLHLIFIYLMPGEGQLAAYAASDL